jgi:predicted ATPase
MQFKAMDLNLGYELVALPLVAAEERAQFVAMNAKKFLAPP